MRSASSGWGATPVLTATVPSSTTCETISTPSPWRSRALATVPRATRAAVSRALARSKIGRASACPGRGRVSGALRAWLASTSGSTGSAAMTVSHLGHSELPTRIATGLPSVTPCRTPPTSSTSSCSKLMRAPRPYPSRRRASSRTMSALVTSIPAGTPSRMATSAGPCDSPAVNQRSTADSVSRTGSRSFWAVRYRSRYRTDIAGGVMPEPSEERSPADLLLSALDQLPPEDRKRVLAWLLGGGHIWARAPLGLRTFRPERLTSLPQLSTVIRGLVARFLDQRGAQPPPDAPAG